MHTVVLAIMIGSFFTSVFESGPLLGSGSYTNYFWILLGVIAAVRDRDLRFDRDHQRPAIGLHSDG
jgi:hypothetical protein